MSYAAISFSQMSYNVDLELTHYKESKSLYTYEKSDFVFLIKRYIARYIKLNDEIIDISVPNIDTMPEDQLFNFVKKVLSDYILIPSSTFVTTNIPVQGYFSDYVALGKYKKDIITKADVEKPLSLGYYKKKDIDFDKMEHQCCNFISTMYNDISAKKLSLEDNLSIVINNHIENGMSLEEVVEKYKTSYLLFISSVIMKDGTWLDVTDFPNHSDFTNLIKEEIDKLSDDDYIKIYELLF